MFEKFFGSGKLESQAIQKIESYLDTLLKATKCLGSVLLSEDEEETFCIEQLEREADILKREIVEVIYKGAFLPFLRPSICNFVEVIEKVFELLKTCAFEYRYLNREIYQQIKPLCQKVAELNVEMCEILVSAFSTLKEKNDLREKNLAIRICEKKVDEIKLQITEKLRRCSSCVVTNFWEGKNLSDFVEALVKISDVIEDASDYLYIMELSLK